jgi:hypothetical protein
VNVGNRLILAIAHSQARQLLNPGAVLVRKGRGRLDVNLAGIGTHGFRSESGCSDDAHTVAG